MGIIDQVRVWLRWIIIRAHHRRFFKPVLRLWCRLGVKRVSVLLLKIPGVEAVYSRHTHPDSSSFVPGHSDLDTAIILSDEAAGSPEMLLVISARIEKLNWIHYYLSPEDVRFTSRRELARIMRNYSSRYEPLYTPDDWVLLGGQEVRSEKALDFPADRMVWHPEFNMWWQHILQHYLLVQKPGLEDQYMRVFFRSALRQQLHFLAASGYEVIKPLGHVDDNQVEEAFGGHQGLRTLLLDLKSNDFWADDPQRLQECILLSVLQLAAEFFQTCSCQPKMIPARQNRSMPETEHTAAYAALRARFDTMPELTGLLKTILVYPVPYFSPYFYQLDLAIPDTLSAAEFRETIHVVHNAFQGREFHVDGYGFSITYVPESILHQPLYFIGSPYPFLKEHVQRYGVFLQGESPPSFIGCLSPEDLVQWCGTFLPYFMSTLCRRIEYSSRSINFCQLAAIRLFLQTGEKETDPKSVRRRHGELFKEDSPEDVVWDYMLLDKPGRGDRKNYRAATKDLLKEVRRVETLLEQKI